MIELKDVSFTYESGETENNLSHINLTIRDGETILLCGESGCGKTTTLYSFLKEINHPKVNVVTVEDPVEYTLHGVNQTQVNVKANMTFATALRSILRQDPDIIMIGEIRDQETAEIAVKASITGHLVVSTLHTNSSANTITRLADMGVENYLIADSSAAFCSVWCAGSVRHAELSGRQPQGRKKYSA